MVGSGYGFEATLKTDANGGITGLNILSSGSAYDEGSYFLIDCQDGSGASLEPVLNKGFGRIKAKLVVGPDQTLESEVKFLASMRSKLNTKEIWLDTYYDSMDQSDQNESWNDRDDDQDGLINIKEFTFNTNPLVADTDGDGLSDLNETNSSTYVTNPLSFDTDEDGLSDGLEIMLGANPLNRDTDSDGLDDYTEYTTAGMDIVVPTKLGKIAGIIRKKENL